METSRAALPNINSPPSTPALVDSIRNLVSAALRGSEPPFPSPSSFLFLSAPPMTFKSPKTGAPQREEAGCSGQGQVRGVPCTCKGLGTLQPSCSLGQRLWTPRGSRGSFWGSTRVNTGPLAVGCRWGRFKGKPVRGVGMSQWGLLRNRGGLSS